MHIWKRRPCPHKLGFRLPWLCLLRLMTPPQPIEWTEPEEAAAIAAKVTAAAEEVIRH